MTREEKEQTGKYVLQMARLLEDGCYQQEMLLKAVRIIDEALEQEPIEPMVEIDLYSVIKQKYIEREVLDKVYADIQKLRGCSCSCSDGIIDDVEDIIDKYKAESEDKE